MLRVYQENTDTAGQLPMSIQQLGNRGDLQEWTELFRETAIELGHNPASLGAAARMEVGLIVCRKMLANQG